MQTKFKYLLDPLFIVCSILYVANKFSILPLHRVNYTFFHGYFDDILLVPVLLPTILVFSSLLKLRPKTCPPKIVEAFVPLVIWSVAFEFVGPKYFGKGTSDILDLAAYWGGGLLGWIIWNRAMINKSIWAILRQVFLDSLLSWFDKRPLKQIK
jgi:hypothetical protein